MTKYQLSAQIAELKQENILLIHQNAAYLQQNAELIKLREERDRMCSERDSWRENYENAVRDNNRLSGEIVEPVRHEWGNGITVLGKEEIRKIANTKAHIAMSDIYGKFVCPECGIETEEEWHDGEVFSRMKYCTACTDKFGIGMVFIRKAPPE